MPSPESLRWTPRSVVLVDDSNLFRQGVARLLTHAGMTVLAELGDTGHLDAVVTQSSPDVVLLDVRMPPTYTDEGVQAALALRRTHSEVGVLVLSTYAEGPWASDLFAEGGSGIGYLLKDRVDDVATLAEAIDRVARGGTVVDPEVVTRLLHVTRRRSLLDPLSTREREVLALMAQGMSNVGIGARLFLSPRTVEAHIAAIFTKLPLDGEDNTLNRRVLAVLAFLGDEPS